MDLIKPSNTGDVTAGGKVIGISIAKITSRQDISYFLSKIIQNTSKGCHKVINIQVTKTDFSAGEFVKSNIVFIQLSPAEGNALISRQHSLLEARIFKFMNNTNFGHSFGPEYDLRVRLSCAKFCIFLF